MTAFTTMFGLVPMAIGGASLIGIPYAPMGRALMGGLFTSTFFTLLAVPLLYTYMDDFRLWAPAFIGRHWKLLKNGQNNDKAGLLNSSDG
jgi:HAE1 family hydrophobic/amphiphilic exporter-1